MNKYYIKGVRYHGRNSYTAHDFKIIKLKKSRRKTANAKKRANRK